jgi:hypothetical protein
MRTWTASLALGLLCLASTAGAELKSLSVRAGGVW